MINLGSIQVELEPAGEKFRLTVRGILHGVQGEMSAGELWALIAYFEKQIGKKEKES